MSKRDPGYKRRPPNSDQYPITTSHQIGGNGQRCVSIQYQDGINVQIVVHQRPLGMGQEKDTGLSS